jgi:hypothetical protein
MTLANTTLTNLPLVIALSGAEQIEVVQAGTSSRAFVSQIVGANLPNTTVAALPSPSLSLLGNQYVVTDASASTYQVGAAVTGGGTNVMRVFCTGSAWVAG